MKRFMFLVLISVMYVSSVFGSPGQVTLIGPGPIYQAESYGSSPNNLSAAITAIGSTSATIQFHTNQTVSTLIIPSNIQLEPENGAVITVTGVLTIEGAFTAPPIACFAGPGTVVFGTNTTYFRPSEWGSQAYAGDATLMKNTNDYGNIIDWTHNGNQSYLMHLKTGSSFVGGANGTGAGPALIGLGIGDGGGAGGGIGILISNKASGMGVELTNEANATGYGMMGQQNSLSSAGGSSLILLQQNVVGAADLLQIATPGAATTGQTNFTIFNSNGGNSLWGYRTFKSEADTGNFDYYNKVHLDGAQLDVSGMDNSGDTGGHIIIGGEYADAQMNIYRYSGGSNIFYPTYFGTNPNQPNEFIILGAPSAPRGSESFWGTGASLYNNALIRGHSSYGTPSLGFFGATPVGPQNVVGDIYSGTGLQSLVTGLTNLGLTGGLSLTNTGTVPITNGGTGATSASAALTNLGALPRSNPVVTGTLTMPSGGTHIYACVGGTNANSLCRGNGCTCSGGTMTDTGIVIP